jgi:hypothetical protein
MFRMGASSLHHNRSVLGDFLRRMKAKLGPAAGITATAHKLAIIFYTVVTKQVEYDDSIWAAMDAQRQKRLEDKLKRQARHLGYELVVIQPANATATASGTSGSPPFGRSLAAETWAELTRLRQSN